MRIAIIYVLFATILFGTIGCFKRWTVQEKKEFELKCSETDSLKNLTFLLSGFEYSEIEKILIKEYSNNILTDSFYINVSKNSYDGKTYSEAITRTLNIKNKYLFCVKGELPYVLENMKMFICPERTMFSENYGCRMREFVLDGITYSNNSNPELVKRK